MKQDYDDELVLLLAFTNTFKTWMTGKHRFRDFVKEKTVTKYLVGIVCVRGSFIQDKSTSTLPSSSLSNGIFQEMLCLFTLGLNQVQSDVCGPESQWPTGLSVLQSLQHHTSVLSLLVTHTMGNVMTKHLMRVIPLHNL